MRANVGVMKSKSRKKTITSKEYAKYKRTFSKEKMTFRNAKAITENPFISSRQKQQMYSNLVKRQNLK